MSVLYLILCIALLRGQAVSPPPPPQTPQAEASNRAKSSPLEISKLRAKAEAGDAVAQLELGTAYEKGNGVQANDALAVTWYRKSAEQGNAEAENDMGIMYRLGKGVEKNKDESVRWYRKAAKLGNALAMFNLGVAYYNGDGVGEDSTLACAWFQLAQTAGDSAAEDAVRRCGTEMGKLSKLDVILQIGEMYEKGDDLPLSYIEAAKWYRKEAEQSPVAAIKVVTLMLAGRTGKPDYGEAMDLCRGAAKRTYAPGEYCVGYLYQRGLGVTPDPKEAAKWLNLAAVHGHTRARLILAGMYLKGDGVAIDRPEAYWFLFFAYQGGALEAKSQAHLLRQEMNKDEIKRTEKKLRSHGLDPKKVFQVMDDPTPPNSDNVRRVLPPVIR